jgi:hypothetical protein
MFHSTKDRYAIEAILIWLADESYNMKDSSTTTVDRDVHDVGH